MLRASRSLKLRRRDGRVRTDACAQHYASQAPNVGVRARPDEDKKSEFVILEFGDGIAYRLEPETAEQLGAQLTKATRVVRARRGVTHD